MTSAPVASSVPVASAAPSAHSHARDRRFAQADSPRDWWVRRLLVGGDVLALVLAGCSWALIGIPDPWDHVLWLLPTLPFWVLLFTAYNLYGAGLNRVGYATIDEVPAVAHALLVGGVGMWFYFQITPVSTVSFPALLSFLAITFVLSTTLRSAARRVVARLMGSERVIFVGSGPMTPLLLRQMRSQRRHGMKPIGVIRRPENDRWPLVLPDMGSLADFDVHLLVCEHAIERVIVSGEGIEDDALLELVNDFRQAGVKISALPSLAAMMGPAATVDHLEGITLIGINTPSLSRSSRFFKRAMDVVGAVVLLVVTAPIWLIAAIAVKLDTPGPVLFRQQRVGRRGRLFYLTKLRSMAVGAEALREDLLTESRQQAWLDLEDDPRITPVGQFLRHTSLDEIPQLWNVLRGDMSLVGPRPLIAAEDENVTGWARGRLDLTPGLTGMWQVMGRATIPFEQMIMLDYLYVANWSLWRDVKLIVQTVPVVLLRRGAN